MAITSITANSAALLLLLFLAATAAAHPSLPPSPPPPRPKCMEELVLFTPCLPYVSAPPNNLTETATPQCCAVFSSALDSGAGSCFCYILRQPMILGFPLDRARVLSLSQICMDGHRNVSLESLCSPSESLELPPLQNTPDTETTRPDDSGNEVAESSSSISLPPESSGNNSLDQFGFPPEPAVRSNPPSSSSVEPAQVFSEAAQTCMRNYWYLPAILLFSILLSVCT